ncbi:MAG TPA: class IV adenylate cyclase [Flavisolibacter sp.]|nr:class IV adenylate cyclase [Flavisolibacter sp.]
MPVNFEFKAWCDDLLQPEETLLSLHPKFIGEDHQVDTYFNVPRGRLKLREGKIENALIYYERSDSAGAKISNVLLYQHAPDIALKHILIKSNGIKAIVDKTRRIYFLDNVKFHFDTVNNLGTFIEVEAIDKNGTIGIHLLQQQCLRFKGLFKIDDKNLIAESYSDMVLAKKYSTSST